MNSWKISGIILLVGFFICLFLILRSKWKAGRKNIDDYQRGRDKLSGIEEEEEEPEETSGGGISIGNIVGGFIVLLVGFTMLPVITESISGACGNELNVTSVGNFAACGSSGAASTLLGILPIVFAIGLVLATIGMLASGLRNTGLI